MYVQVGFDLACSVVFYDLLSTNCYKTEQKNWATSNEKLPLNMCKISRFISFSTCACICCPMIHSIVSNDSVSRQQWPDQTVQTGSLIRVFAVRICSEGIFSLDMAKLLTLKAPRKSASENVVFLCRLLHLLANFSNLYFAYRQTVWTQIRLLLKEQSDLGPHCLQK